MRRPILGYLIVAIAVIIVLANTLFVVDQRDQAIVVRFGNPVRVINAPGQAGAGLNIKAPFLEHVITLDRRNLSLEADQEEVIAADQERLVVDAFLRYRISNPLQFYRTLRNDSIAQDRLERLVNSSLRQVLGSATSTDIISGNRAYLMQQTRLDVARRATQSRLGIQVIDLRIKRADLPAANQDAVFRRMKTSREQEAARIRAVGEQQKREIMASANKEVTITLATAQQQGETTRGQGDAERTRILGQAFGKDASFAAFYRSMQAYDTSLGRGAPPQVRSPDSDFFRYFERGANAAGGGASGRSRR
jgi:membrane protease subunit HflC